MDVEISIEEEKIGADNSIKEEFKKDEGGAFKETLGDEIGSSNEDEIWRKRRERFRDALAAGRNAERHDPGDVFEAVRRLQNIILRADVEQFIWEIERLAESTHPSVILSRGAEMGRSAVHVAAYSGDDDILRLLLDDDRWYLMMDVDNSGNTPLHLAIRTRCSPAAAMLIRRARDIPRNRCDGYLRMKNQLGNTALHEAVLCGAADVVHDLLKEDLEPVYMKNACEASPLYLAIESKDPKMHELLFSLPLETWRIEGLPPIHGAITQARYDLANLILKKNMKLFAMTDSRGGNVFHLAAYLNKARVFKLLGPDTAYLAQEHDENGDLPIHIAAKMDHVELIKKLIPVACLPNRQGQTVLHVAAKYGRTSAVKYLLRDTRLQLIKDADHAKNTPLHLAAMYSQPAALIPLVLDKNTDPGRINHESLTAFDIAQDRFRRDPTLRKRLTFIVSSHATIGKSPAVSRSLIVLRPEDRDEALRRKKLNVDHVRDLLNTRLLVATLVATVTFAAGFAVPGGFNGSDTASKDDQGMATMLDKRLFQAFVICNTIAMFCSMIAVINLIYVQPQNDIEVARAALQHSALPFIVALPAMSIAFLTGVTLTVGKLPWLANTIFYLGLFLLLIVSGATLIEYPPVLWSHHRPIRRLILWLVVAYIYFWDVGTYLLDDLEDDRDKIICSSQSHRPLKKTDLTESSQQARKQKAAIEVNNEGTKDNSECTNVLLYNSFNVLSSSNTEDEDK